MKEETLNLTSVKNDLQKIKDSNSKIIYLYNAISFMFNLLKEKNLLIKYWRERAEALGDNILVEKDAEIIKLKEQLQKSKCNLEQAKATEKLLLEKLASSLKQVEETFKVLKQERQLNKLGDMTEAWKNQVKVLVDNELTITTTNTTTISSSIPIREIKDEDRPSSRILYKQHTSYNKYGNGFRY